MKKLLSDLIKFIDLMNILVFNISKWIMVPLTIIVVYEVISRYLFNAPHIWVLEVTTFLGGAFFMLSIGYVTLKEQHVTIDIFKDFLSPKAKAIIDIITYTFLYCVFSFVMLIYGTKFAINSWVTTEHSWSSWAPALYPIKTVVPIVAFLFLIQGLAFIMRKVVFLIEGEDKKSL
ncbi:MAG: TRAP transporter small permease subunit [Candidatus Atribacteria bacterium]|nr:TRAP transporter small permease subunit [Candidatus Atribacteria bacterium]